MQNYFYRDNSGREIGPLNLSTLAQLRFAGVLNDDTPVRAADSEKWMPCRDVVVTSAAPTPPQPVNAGTGRTSVPPTLVVLIIIGALVYGGTVLYKRIAAETMLTYGFLLDGKEIAKGLSPEIKVDGQLFENGNHLKPGRHQISVHLNNVEPYERHFWIFHGTKDLGNLPLETCKGSLFVTVSPMPAIVSVQQAGQIIKEGDAPLKMDKLTAGIYQLAIKHGNYGESHDVEVKRQQQTDSKIQLNLGDVGLASVPPEADYVMDGDHNRHWQGKLPATIADVPVGNYAVKVSRQGWELSSDITVTVAGIVTNVTKFPYASISITSEPSGLVISSGGNTFGKSPITLQMKPGNYDLTASDGENDLTENIMVGPDEVLQKAFVFHYGTLKLASTPSGANVLRKGKIIGVTPMTLDRIPTSGLTLELEHADYESTNIFAATREREVTTVTINLVNSRYAKAMRQAREASDAGQFDQSQNFLALALSIQPSDSNALQLQDVVVKAKVAAKVREIALLPWLDFEQMVSDCTDVNLVHYPVQMDDGYYQDYYDMNGKKRTRFIKTGQHTEIHTRTESVFNQGKFSTIYGNKMFRFNCPEEWTVKYIDKSGLITIKKGRGLLGADNIKVNFLANYQEAAKVLQVGQKIKIKGRVTRYEPGVLIRTLYLEDTEFLE